MGKLRISVEKDDEYVYFLVNRSLLPKDLEEEDLAEMVGKEIEIEVPIITQFIFEELDYLDALPEEIAIGQRYLAIKRSNEFPSREMVPIVKKIIKRCFLIEELISKI